MTDALKPDLPAEHFLQVFMPGAIIVAGAWYLHRPFLMKYFPAIASEVSQPGTSGASFGLRALVLVVLCLCAGVLTSQLADVAVVGLVTDGSTSIKARRWDRGLWRFCFRAFIFSRRPDPRVHVIKQYLNSRRKEWFLEMMTEWADTDEKALASPDESIKAHQHIIAHLAALSEQAQKSVKDAYAEVLMSSSLFLSLFALLVLADTSIWSNSAVRYSVPTQPTSILLTLTIFIYFICCVAAVVVRRRFANFCASSITRAIHYHRISRGRSNENPVPALPTSSGTGA